MTHAFTSVLIANRGEIAVRIARSVQAAGMRAIAVFSDVDQYARHVSAADQAVALGGATAAVSYLDQHRILAAAQACGAGAIHPGYGFLSENAEFATACAAAGIVFIGPSPAAIELMGNKRAAKLAVQQADVPCIPGYEGADQTDAALINAAAAIGVPLMVKAAAGGGGRGMRLVRSLDDLPAALASARLEARNAFGNDELILEQAIFAGRHIEVQVVADAHGNVIHLGERDCSLQRRHQKVVEEAPSPFVDPPLRAAMGQAAVNAARSCDYLGVGTVEFLVAADRSFCFLEMNTRLQVEHPVTEQVTGMDLVDLQLTIAAGKPLPITQDEVQLAGHAIEVRLYAEDPAAGFLPQIGPIVRWDPPAGSGIRVDHGLQPVDSVSAYYDPMIAKIIASGTTREQARSRLDRALCQSVVLGIETNQWFLRHLINDPVFVAGDATTNYVDDSLADDLAGLNPANPTAVALATSLLLECQDPQPADLRHWSNAEPMPRRRRMVVNGTVLDVVITARPEATSVTVSDQAPVTVSFTALDRESGYAIVEVDGVQRALEFAYVADGVEDLPTLYLQHEAQQVSVTDLTYRPPLAADAAASGSINAATEGQVVAIHVAEGDTVTNGQTLVVVEAMKMEHRHNADGDGVVSAVTTAVGTQVKKGAPLVQLTLNDATGEE